MRRKGEKFARLRIFEESKKDCTVRDTVEELVDEAAFRNADPLTMATACTPTAAIVASCTWTKDDGTLRYMGIVEE